jgi:hypothetical protein
MCAALAPSTSSWPAKSGKQQRTRAFDLVYEAAAQLHADKLDALLDRRKTELEAAEAGEAARRKQLINGELKRRARKRLPG